MVFSVQKYINNTLWGKYLLTRKKHILEGCQVLFAFHSMKSSQHFYTDIFKLFSVDVNNMFHTFWRRKKNQICKPYKIFAFFHLIRKIYLTPHIHSCCYMNGKRHFLIFFWLLDFYSILWRHIFIVKLWLWIFVLFKEFVEGRNHLWYTFYWKPSFDLFATR